MAKKIKKHVKKASPFLLILLLVGILVGFNYWTSKASADSETVTTQVTVGNEAPVVSAVSLGTVPTGADNITLVEDDDIEIRVSATVTDSGGCSDIQGAEAYVFISSISDHTWDYGETGTPSFDYNEAFTPSFEGGNLNCEQLHCSGGTAVYQCGASESSQGGDGMWYHTTPTDSTASLLDEWWVALVWASDSYSADAFASTATGSPDVVIQAAIALTAGSDAINYGSVIPGGESANLSSEGVENTGNRAINITIVAASDMSSGDNDIATDAQEYSLTDFEVAEGDANATSLSASPALVDVILNKPTTHTQGDNDDEIFWGIAIPSGTVAGSYTGGQTTYTTVAD